MERAVSAVCLRAPLSPDEDKLDIALREIGEGKLIAEVDFDAMAKQHADQKWF
jgi:hypothetical protein